MGVRAPLGITRFYYFAYWVGLFVSGGVFWVSCKLYPPAVMYPLREWREPKNYIRPEEEGPAIDGESIASGEAPTYGETKEGLHESVTAKHG